MQNYFVTDNRIINGDFLIDQRNEFAANTPSATKYVADMVKFETSGLGSAFTFQVQSSVSPSAFSNALMVLVAVNSTPTAAQYAVVTFPIEGINVSDCKFGAVNARGINVSFFARSSVPGTYILSARNSANNRSYCVIYKINSANLWQYYTIFIPGDTAGTWLTSQGSIGLVLGFDLGSGSNFIVARNTWSAGNFTTVSGNNELITTAGATLYIANVVVSTSPVSQPSYSPRPFPLEKELCYRYFQKTFPDGTAPAQNAGLAGAITIKNPIALGDPSEWWQFIPKMAKTPTITTYNPSAANANWRDITAGADATVSVDPASTIGNSGVLIATSGTVATLGDVLAIHATADAGL